MSDTEDLPSWLRSLYKAIDSAQAALAVCEHLCRFEPDRLHFVKVRMRLDQIREMLTEEENSRSEKQKC
jgi:hypothetical protein